MSITTFHPSSLVELAPELPALAHALTEEQHQQQLDEQQRQVNPQGWLTTSAVLHSHYMSTKLL